MSSNKRDVVSVALLTAAAMEGFEALKILACMWADPEQLPEVKARFEENQKILMTNFTK